MLVATDFFTAQVWTLGGLVMYSVLFFIHLESREIHVAGVTPHPNAVWMVQVARRKSLRVRHHWCKDTVEYFDSTASPLRKGHSRF